MLVDDRPITIDKQGARWAYSLGFWHHREIPCPFIVGTPHHHFWTLGAQGKRFLSGGWDA